MGVQISWGELFSPMTYLNVTKKINIPRATCFVVSVVSGRKCLSRGGGSSSSSSSSGEEGTEESLITQSLFTMPMILFMREFLIGTSESRRNALLGVATPVVASVVRLRWMKKLTASEVVRVFVPEKEKQNEENEHDKNTVENWETRHLVQEIHREPLRRQRVGERVFGVGARGVGYAGRLRERVSYRADRWCVFSATGSNSASTPCNCRN